MPLGELGANLGAASMDNIFGLWRDGGRELPFAARRWSWRSFVVVVCRVEPKGKYGQAFGYVVSLDPARPIEATGDAWGATAAEPAEISNAGSYQWERVAMP